MDISAEIYFQTDVKASSDRTMRVLFKEAWESKSDLLCNTFLYH